MDSFYETHRDGPIQIIIIIVILLLYTIMMMPICSLLNAK